MGRKKKDRGEIEIMLPKPTRTTDEMVRAKDRADLLHFLKWNRQWHEKVVYDFDRWIRAVEDI